MAINHSRRTAIFLAATDGPVDTHLNLFNAANKLLYAVTGLPPLPLHHPNRQSNARTHIAVVKPKQVRIHFASAINSHLGLRLEGSPIHSNQG